MTKYEWERELKKNIQALPSEEIARILDYYDELFEDKSESGMSETAIIREFGNPFDVARRIINEFEISDVEGTAAAQENEAYQDSANQPTIKQKIADSKFVKGVKSGAKTAYTKVKETFVTPQQNYGKTEGAEEPALHEENTPEPQPEVQATAEKPAPLMNAFEAFEAQNTVTAPQNAKVIEGNIKKPTKAPLAIGLRVLCYIPVIFAVIICFSVTLSIAASGVAAMISGGIYVLIGLIDIVHGIEFTLTGTGMGLAAMGVGTLIFIASIYLTKAVIKLTKLFHKALKKA